MGDQLGLRPNLIHVMSWIPVTERIRVEILVVAVENLGESQRGRMKSAASAYHCLSIGA